MRNTSRPKHTEFSVLSSKFSGSVFHLWRFYKGLVGLGRLAVDCAVHAATRRLSMEGSVTETYLETQEEKQEEQFTRHRFDLTLSNAGSYQHSRLNTAVFSTPACLRDNLRACHG